MDKIDGPYYFFKLLQRLRKALPQWFPLAGPEGGQTNMVPVDFVAKAMDHIAHLSDDELPGDTFHLTNPEPMSVGQALNEFAKAGHAPQFAMRVDSHLTNAIPKPVRAGFKQLPPVKRIRAAGAARLRHSRERDREPRLLLHLRLPRHTARARGDRHRGATALVVRGPAVGLLGAQHGPGALPRPLPDPLDRGQEDHDHRRVVGDRARDGAEGR